MGRERLEWGANRDSLFFIKEQRQAGRIAGADLPCVVCRPMLAASSESCERSFAPRPPGRRLCRSRWEFIHDHCPGVASCRLNP